MQVTYNTQNLYLKGDIDLDEAFDNILEMAKSCKMNPKEFYQNLVASHPRNAGSAKKVKQLIACLDEADRGQAIFENCLVKISRNEDPETLKRFFNEHTRELLMFLKKMHKEMLTSPDDQEKYRHIKRGFRDILIYLMKSQDPDDYFFKSTDARILQDELIHFRRDYLCRFSIQKVASFIQNQINQGEKTYRDCLNQIGQSGDLEQIKALFINNLPQLELFLKKMHREKSVKKGIREILQYFYINSPSLGKVNHFDGSLDDLFKNNVLRNMFSNYANYRLLSEFGVAVKRFCEEESDIDMELLPLLKITFIHGTNAAILPNLRRTGMQLLSSGRLIRSGILPFSGELDVGSSLGGTNQYKISGTSLVGNMAYSYAVNQNYCATQSLEEAKIGYFLESVERKSPLFERAQDATDKGSFWKNVAISIMRIRTLYPDFYHSNRDKLQTTIGKIDADWIKFKETGEYRRNMPEGTFWSYLGYKSNDFTLDFKAAEDSITSLKRALTDKVVVPEGIDEAVQNPYGLVLASETLHTESLVIKRGFHDTHPERSAQKASKLGKDIQMIFVAKENRAHLASFLKENELDQKVTLVDMDCLPKAIQLNEIALPYFADIASKRKIKRV